MKVKEIGEYPLVARLCQQLERVFGIDKRVVVGLGDDASVLELKETKLVLTIDTQIEDVHFRRRWMPPFELGWKSVAISISDVVAMGGKPVAALLAIGLTGDETVSFVDKFYEGAIALCQSTKTLLLGGDTARSPNGLMVSSVVVGVLEGEPIKRSGVQVGDSIVVTGFVGEASAGFWLLEQGKGEIATSPPLHHCIERFRKPEPRVNAVQVFRSFQIHAAIDISDGLVIDAQRIAMASNVQILLDFTKLPLSQALLEAAKITGKDALSLALTGGEDYELLLSVPPSVVTEFCQAMETAGIPAHQIGKVIARHDEGQVLGRHSDGTISSLQGGFQHF